MESTEVNDTPHTSVVGSGRKGASSTGLGDLKAVGTTDSPHRVHEVIDDVCIGACCADRVPIEEVACCDLNTFGPGNIGEFNRIAHEDADPVPGGQQEGYQATADIPGGPRNQNQSIVRLVLYRSAHGGSLGAVGIS
ncbi:hypothetical protein GCM10022198_07100 [Klugiella xanthotipulae]